MRYFTPGYWEVFLQRSDASGASRRFPLRGLATPELWRFIYRRGVMRSGPLAACVFSLLALWVAPFLVAVATKRTTPGGVDGNRS